MSGQQLQAVAATHRGDGTINITVHPATRTDLGFLMLDDGEWVYVDDINEEPDAIVTIVEPEDSGLIDEIAEEVRTDLWCRLAGYGIV